MASNSAAWVTAPSKRLEVRSSPYPTPKADEIVVKNRAIAINPIDWILQDFGTAFSFPWLKYPVIFGHDVSGEVVQVGSSVTRFKVGDRVVGYAAAIDKNVNDPAYGGFQLYTVLLERTTSPIPETVSFESASVIPLALCTAAGGLFEKDQLALQYPSILPKPTGKTLLVWGGSTSVGCNAIQLAVAAGYEVFSTSSPKNFDYLKTLGAIQVFDYNDPSVVSQIAKAMEGKTSAGAIAIGHNSATICLDVLGRCKGHKHVAQASIGPASPPKRFALLQMMFAAVTTMVAVTIKSKLKGIPTSFIWGSSPVNSDVGPAVYVDFLPEALAKGTFVPAPEPMVAGEGLESVQSAMDIQKKGVSRKKVVVTLK